MVRLQRKKQFGLKIKHQTLTDPDSKPLPQPRFYISFIRYVCHNIQLS